MISFKHKFIFIHIPRTAGTSIENALSEYSEDYVNGVTIKPNSRLVKLARDKKVSLDNYKHFPYSSYKKILGDEIKDFLVFSVMRHPKERIPSLYYYNNITGVSLTNFIGGIENGVRIVPSVSMKLNSINHFFGDVEEIFLLQYQNLKEDWITLLNKLNLPYKKLEHLNKGRSLKYDALWNDYRLNKTLETVFESELKKPIWDKKVQYKPKPRTFLFDLEQDSILYDKLIDKLNEIGPKLLYNEILDIYNDTELIKDSLLKMERL